MPGNRATAEIPASSIGLPESNGRHPKKLNRPSMAMAKPSGVDSNKTSPHPAAHYKDIDNSIPPYLNRR
jgi:hypothetical protein